MAMRKGITVPFSFLDLVLLKEGETHSNACAIRQMMSYPYIGTVDTIREGLGELLEKAGVNEIMVSTAIYEEEDRMHSLSLTADAIGSISAPTVNSAY